MTTEKRIEALEQEIERLKAYINALIPTTNLQSGLHIECLETDYPSPQHPRSISEPGVNFAAQTEPLPVQNEIYCY